MHRNRFVWFLAILVEVTMASSAHSQTIWNGPSITFSKPGFADPSDPASQDRMTPNVWITRADTQGIYNAAQEGSYTSLSSPADTAWAVGTTADLGSLVFSTWEGTVGVGTPINGPPNAVGVDMVMHLISEDIYLDMRFLSWGMGFSSGGNFSYQRSTPIPEPATAPLALIGLAALGCGWRRRWLAFSRAGEC